MIRRTNQRSRKVQKSRTPKPAPKAAPVVSLGTVDLNPLEAIRLFNACGRDAGNRHMRKAGRTSWSRSDYNAACRVSNKLARTLGLAP